MLILIILTVILVAVIWAGMYDQSWGAAGAAGFVGVTFGLVVFVIASALIMIVRGGGEWVKTEETVYELAEGSSVASDSGRVSFVAELDGGEVSGVSVEASDVSVTALEDASEVVVVDWHLDLGYAIFPWGEGENKRTVVVR